MWLKLTDRDNIDILINSDKIEAITINDENDLTNLALFGTNQAYSVKETVDEIYKLLNPKQNWN